MMIRAFLLGFLICCLSLQNVHAQVGGIRATYLSDMQWKKVIVCLDDRTVFALSARGEVYFKKSEDTAFQVYGPMRGRTVADFAGYNMDELYFLIAPRELIYVKNGISITVNTAVFGITDIRNIATVHAGTNELVSGYMYGDWLAIATNNNLCPLLRHEENIVAPYTSPDVEVMGGTGWRISNSGFKAIDFQFEDNIVDACVGPIKNAYLNYVGLTPYKTVLPEAAPYPDKVNCTYFEAPFNEYGMGVITTASFWGTDDGIYAQKSFGCDPSTIRKALGGEVIYDLEEVNMLPSVANMRWLYVAGSKGLHYSVLPVNRMGLWFVENGFNFYDYPRLIDVPVYSMATEINNLDELCENVLWLATERGLMELPLHHLDPVFSTIDKLIYSEPIDGDHFDMCPGREITMTANVADGYERNYHTEWFKEGVELTELRGQKSVTFKEPAIYHYRLRSNCNDAYIEQRIWLRKIDDPEITFKPDSVMNICAGSTITFTTKSAADYRYQWYKDDEKIEGATDNSYIASTGGKYKVMVTNCMEGYLPSDEVQLNVISLDKPVITRSNNSSLCFGEGVNLSVPAISGATYLWSNGETTAAIEVTQSGIYNVQIQLGNCSTQSDAVAIDIGSEIILDQYEEVVICELRNSSVRLSADEGFASYTWNGVKSTSNYWDVTAAGEYKLQVEDNKGCTAITTYLVISKCETLAPNAFSPNGDGINDRWVVEGLTDDPEARILIYNRYGSVIYETSGKQAYWDGKSKDQMVSAGIYYYVIFTKNAATPLKGSITLIK